MSTDIQEQIKRRRERAREEILEIVNKGSHPLFSQFEVKSVSGRAYRVEIRSLDELQNSCTCPDYKTNLMGTCKHIEGVLITLREEYGDKLEKLLKQRPRGTQIYLHYGAEITVRVAFPLPDSAFLKVLLTRYFDPSGALVGAPLQTLPTLFAGIESLPAREKSLVSVTEAVREYLALLQDREDVAYHAVSLPSAPVSDSALIESRCKRAREGLVFAEKRFALAELLLKGGFPEEMTRPLREALGWGLTSLLALYTNRDPAADLPSPRLVQAELVEQGHLPLVLSQRFAQTRDLTAPPDHGEDSPLLSTQIGQTLLDSVNELVSLVQEQTVKAGI